MTTISMKWRIALILLAGTLAYSNAFSGPFIFDDESTVLENQSIHDGSLIDALRPAREIPTAGRPLVNLTFAANYAVGGIDVRGYRVVNVAIHLLCGLLIFGCVRRTLALAATTAGVRAHGDDIAFATALLWTLHPLNTEVVDYLTQRTESTMAACYLLTLYAAIRAHAGDHARKWQTIAVVACAAGMACKESMVSAPVMVLLYDRAFAFGSWRDAWRKRWRLYASLAGTWTVLGALMWSGPRVFTVGFATQVTPWTYLLNQTVMLTRYLRLAVWPQSLVLAYGLPSPLALADVLPYALFVVALLVATAVVFVQRPALGFVGIWFFVTLAPTSTFVPIATEVGAERRMYLPLVALIAYAVGGAWHLWSTRPARRPVWLAPAALAIAATLLGYGTFMRNREYASPLTIAETVLQRWPSSFAHAMVGNQLAAAGHHQEAIAHLHQAAPSFALAAFHLGGELFNQGQLDAAISQLQDFVRREPLRVEAVRARTILARAFMMQRKWNLAIDQLQQVLAMTSDGSEDHTVALGFMADTQMAQERYDDAAATYREYLRRRLKDVGAATNLGVALEATGHPSDARLAFQRAVEIDPRDANARRNLAKALLNQNDAAGATAEAARLLRLYPNDPVGHDLLGRALAMQGKLDEAFDEFARAVQLNPRDEQSRQDLAAVDAARRQRR
jgi:protein O-mannosyl-transferase